MNTSRKFLPTAFTALILAGAGIVGATSASASGRPLIADLAAFNEVNNAGVPVPGDFGATGFAYLTLTQGQAEICFELAFDNLTAAPSRAHIHRGVAGRNGPVVATFYETGSPALTKGCIAVVEELVKEIRKNPADFYVNVHNATAPAGAVRGQLMP